MELTEASAVLQSLRNTFRAVQRLGEVIDAAQAADTLLAEKTKAVEAKQVELDAISTQVANAKERDANRSLGAERTHEARVAKLNAEFATLTEGFEFAKKEIGREVAEAQTARDKAVDSLAKEVKDLTVQRDELQQAVGDLTSQLDQLKARITGA